ncbi:MAG: hypothetical protein V4585_09820 [Bacteroidota bacterium]
MSKKSENISQKTYVNQLRSEILAQITDEWTTKWSKNHGTHFTGITNLINQDFFFDALRIDIGLLLAPKWGDREAINRNISTDTICRFFDSDYEKTFSKNTLDVLAIYAGYEDYTEFKRQNANIPLAPIVNIYTLVSSPREIREIPKYIYEFPQRQKANRWRWAVFFTCFLAALGGYYYFYQYRPFRILSKAEISNIKFEIITKNNNYNPSKVTFAYDFSSLGVDSIQVFFGGNRGIREHQSETLTKKKGTYTFDFYKPGLYFIEIYHLNQRLKRIPVYLKSHGWACWYVNSDWINTNFPYKHFYVNQIMFLHPDKISNASHRNNYNQVIRKSEIFKISTDSLTLEYDLKYSPDDYAISCYDHTTVLSFDNNRKLFLIFGREGCNDFTPKNTYAFFNKELNEFRFSFPHIFYEWTHIKLQWKNKRIKLWLNNQLVNDATNDIPTGNLIDLTLESKGSAMYDNFLISNSYTQKIAFEDNFNTIPQNTTGY